MKYGIFINGKERCCLAIYNSRDLAEAMTKTLEFSEYSDLIVLECSEKQIVWCTKGKRRKNAFKSNRNITEGLLSDDGFDSKSKGRNIKYRK